MKDVVIVFGGDGFCGWPTSLRLADSGYKLLSWIIYLGAELIGFGI